MDVVFERGSSEDARGHALLYFRSSSDPEEVWATYVVILPIKVDIAKYVPPFLMNQVGELGPRDFSAFAFPPAPEKVEGRQHLEKLASIREDDILFCGTFQPTDIASALMRVNEAVQRYAEMWSQRAAQHPLAPGPAEAGAGLAVNEVLYGLMSDADKLSELTKLVGRLRFAVEGGDATLIREAEEDIKLLSKHLPESHQIPRLVEVAKSKDRHGAALADLYLQRCFHLTQEEYAKLGEVESKIRALESGAAQ